MTSIFVDIYVVVFEETYDTVKTITKSIGPASNHKSRFWEGGNVLEEHWAWTIRGGAALVRVTGGHD